MGIMEQFSIKDKVIVLTGAAGFLGKHYSKVFKELGAELVVADIKNAISLASELGCGGWNVDISKKGFVMDLFGDVEHIYGKLDVLINNAASHQTTLVGEEMKEFEDFPLEVWKNNLDVNLTGTFLCCQEAVRIMKKQGNGVILNIGSVYGTVGCDQRIYGNSKINSSAAYATTKGGIINLTRYLAAYLGKYGIRVNCLSPGGVYNNQAEEFVKNYEYKTMLGSMADKDDLTAAILYLISDASKWVTGVNMLVDGGWTAW